MGRRVRKRNTLSTPRPIRTGNLRFRRPMLYPIELGVLAGSSSAKTGLQCLQGAVGSILTSNQRLPPREAWRHHHGKKNRGPQERGSQQRLFLSEGPRLVRLPGPQHAPLRHEGGDYIKDPKATERDLKEAYARFLLEKTEEAEAQTEVTLLDVCIAYPPPSFALDHFSSNAWTQENWLANLNRISP